MHRHPQESEGRAGQLNICVILVLSLWLLAVGGWAGAFASITPTLSPAATSTAGPIPVRSVGVHRARISPGSTTG
jgi:hypothetical protein